MAIVSNGPGAYAPPSAVRMLIERYRERGLQTPFTHEVLIRAGVSESLTSRTLASLRLLDLIDEQGNPLEAMNVLRTARGDEFQERLRAILQAAYADIFAFVDPATATEEQVRDAFRSNTPHGRQERMVTLFLRLCEWAGIRSPGAVEGNGGPARGARKAVALTRRQAQPARTRTDAAPRRGQERGQQPGPDIPAPITTLLMQLPERGWTKTRRDAFMRAFESIVDFLYPVVPEDEPEN